MLVGSTDSSRYRSHVHPVRKFISPDIASYTVYVGQSSHPLIKLTIEMEGEMLMSSTDTAGTEVKLWRNFTSSPEVYIRSGSLDPVKQESRKGCAAVICCQLQKAGNNICAQPYLIITVEPGRNSSQPMPSLWLL
jgi:hypothetical protein